MTAASTADRIVAGKLVDTTMGMQTGNQNLRKALTDRTVQVVVADNVADYVAANYKKGQTYEVGGFPCLAPPWNHAWIEYKNQGTERRGVYLLAFDLPKLSPSERAEINGLVGAAIKHAEEQFPNRKPRWAVSLVVFVDKGQEVVGPVGSIILILDEYGAELGNRWYVSPDVKWREADAEQGMTLWRMATPAMQTIAFSNCKNVVIERGARSPKLAKAYKKRHGHEPVRWQTVRLELPRSAQERREAGEKGITPSLHIVAGHWAHFGNCCPSIHAPHGKLFGKLEGVYWLSQHLRGDSSSEVRSDRVVTLKNLDVSV